jgi:integrase
MATLRHVTARGRDNWVLRFYVRKQRKSLTLSRVDEQTANIWKFHIEQLVSVLDSSAPPKPTRVWLSGLNEAQTAKLVNVGLIDAPEQEEESEQVRVLLSDYVATYFASVESGMKETTRTFYRHTRKRLNEYFAGKYLDEITAIDARKFRTWLEAESNKRDKAGEDGKPVPLAANTVKRRIGACKLIFGQAVKDGLITKDPFDGMVSTVRSNKARKIYVPMETINLVLAKARAFAQRSPANAHWPALLVLARVAGLRMPSEVCRLTWADVSWEAKRLTVHSPKTEHHAGRESRVVPLFPALEEELLKLYTMDGEVSKDDRIFPSITSETNLRTGLLRLIKAAGVKQWPKLWHNLRASAASDMARALPAHVATAICGHSEDVAREHYWTVRNEDLDLALGAPEIGAPIGAPHVGQNEATEGNSEEDKSSPETTRPSENQGSQSPAVASTCQPNGRRGTRTPDIHFVRVAL